MKGGGGIGEGRRAGGGCVAITVANQKYIVKGRDILTSTQDEEAVDDEGEVHRHYPVQPHPKPSEHRSVQRVLNDL